MASLFISYSRKDIKFARKLTEAFKGLELDFWIDWEGIPPTVDWWKEIEKGIEEADIFLFLISPDSAKSTVCKREIEYAAKNGKRLIPVVVRDVKADECPAELRPLNWIFFRDQENFKASFSLLITAVKTNYEWVQAHRQLQNKALEWERSNKEHSFLLRGKELQDAEFMLTTNLSKEPIPTNLQREYVSISREASDKQRRTTTTIAALGFIILMALAFYGLRQAQRATANAEGAQAASTLAFENAQTARASAANAQTQADIALARRIAAQAQSILAGGDEQQETAVLLGAYSMRLFPSWEAVRVLQNNSLAPMIAQMKNDGLVLSVAFSPDNMLVASGDSDGTTRVWDAATGREIARIRSDNYWVESVAFSPNGRYVVSAGVDECYFSSGGSGACLKSTARIWEATSGKELAQITHDDLISSVAFSPDGKYIVSGSLDKTARVWEVATGKEIARMTHDKGIQSVAFSPDGKYVVSGSWDYTARVWEALTGKEIARMMHDGYVRSVAFSPDGKYVASASGSLPLVLGARNEAVLVWEAATGKEIIRMAHDDIVKLVAFSPDGKYIVSASQDNIARVWEITSGNEIARMTNEYIGNNTAWSVAFRSYGIYIVSAGCDEINVYSACIQVTVRVREVTRGKDILRTTHATFEGVSAVALSPDSEYLVEASEDTARVWKVSSAAHNEISRMTYGGSISSVAFSPDSKYIVSGTEDRIASVWEAITGKEIARMIHDDHVLSVAFSPDGNYVVSGSADGTARVWEAMTGKEIVRRTFEGWVDFVTFSSDGKYVASVSGDTTIVWEVHTGKDVARINGAVSVAFSPDTKYIVAGGCDEVSVTNDCIQGFARIWELATNRQVSSKTYDKYVSYVAFSPDGKYIVSLSGEQAAYVWETGTGKESARLTHDEHIIDAVAFSPDSKYIVSGGRDKTARVWEIATGKEIARMTHDDVGSVVAFSPDSKYVVSGSDDGTARVWEATTGHEIVRLIHNDWVSALAFSPDGKFVVSGSGDHTARAWIWQPEDLIADACSRVTRNLTRAEWKQYIGDEHQYQAICPNLSIEPAATPTP